MNAPARLLASRYAEVLVARETLLRALAALTAADVPAVVYGIAAAMRLEVRRLDDQLAMLEEAVTRAEKRALAAQ